MTISGTVLFFSFSKGFGFARPDGDGADIKDVFVHRSHLGSAAEMRQLNEGTTISFDVESTEKGPEARNVEVLVAAEAPERAPRPSYPENAMHIGGMPVGTTEDGLAALFSNFTTTHVSVVASTRADQRACHGVVCLENADDLAGAIAAVNGTFMGDAAIVVEEKRTGGRARGGRGGAGGEDGEKKSKKKKKRTKKEVISLPNSLHVGNVSWETTDETFAALFAAYNTTAVEVIRQSGGRSRGFGVVSLAEAGDMDRVIADVNGTEVDGRELLIEAKN